MFITSSGPYEYLVMPFELKNAHAVSQHFLNEVLWEALNHYMFVYLSDILIYSCSSGVCQVFVSPAFTK